MLRELDGVALAEHIVLADDDLDAANTAEHPDRVVPAPGTGATVEGRRCAPSCRARSWNVLRLTGGSLRLRPLLLALALALALAAWPAAPAGAAATDPIAHDPTLIKQGALLLRRHHRRQRDPDLPADAALARPRALGVPRAGVHHPAGVGRRRRSARRPRDFWAPDIRYFNGEYHLYYAAS